MPIFQPNSKVIVQFGLWMRKLHRVVMWLAIGLFIPMASTGLALDDISEGEVGVIGRMLNLFINANQIRSIHRSLSTFFVLALTVMIASGLVIWSLPLIQRWLMRDRAKD